MQVYVVSLKDSIDRQKSIIIQCKILGISPIFIDAIDGKKLSESEISQYCSQKKAKQLFGRELLLGEIGCALSHKKIYQKMVDENISYAVILEDDVLIEEDFNKVIKSILSLDKNCELVLLGHHKNFFKGQSSPLSVWNKSHIDSKFTLNYLADFGFGTYGYMITLKGAKKLLVELNKIQKPIDHYTSDYNIINVYALSPTVINIHDHFDTLIDENRTRFSKDRLSVILLKKIGVIDAAVSLKNFLKTLKTVKKYK